LGSERNAMRRAWFAESCMLGSSVTACDVMADSVRQHCHCRRAFTAVRNAVDDYLHGTACTRQTRGGHRASERAPLPSLPWCFVVVIGIG
jgi:hypothetical protein